MDAAKRIEEDIRRRAAQRRQDEERGVVLMNDQERSEKCRQFFRQHNACGTINQDQGTINTKAMGCMEQLRRDRDKRN